MPKPKGTFHPNIDNFVALVQEIEELRDARDILKELFHGNGPYSGTWKLTSNQLTVIQRYFGFDDSE